MIKDKKAEMGVGTLVIFIAMLIVAAIAAGVLITTIGSLQQKALITGQESKGEISTHATVVTIFGTDGGLDGDIQNVTMIMKLAAGSDPISLTDTLMSVGLSNSTGDYRFDLSYNYVGAAAAPTGVYATSNYGVEYLINGSEHRTGMLSRGDVGEFFFWPPRPITEDEKVRFVLIPKIGTQTLVEFRTPDVFSTERIYLYP